MELLSLGNSSFNVPVNILLHGNELVGCYSGTIVSGKQFIQCSSEYITAWKRISRML